MQPDSFFFNVLPFAEDVREFQFPSFNNLPASLQPDEDQQQATDNFVKMLNLGPSDDLQEELLPDFTPNPVLEVCLCALDALQALIAKHSCYDHASLLTLLMLLHFSSLYGLGRYSHLVVKILDKIFILLIQKRVL